MLLIEPGARPRSVEVLEPPVGICDRYAVVDVDLVFPRGVDHQTSPNATGTNNDSDEGRPTPNATRKHRKHRAISMGFKGVQGNRAWREVKDTVEYFWFSHANLQPRRGAVTLAAPFQEGAP